jgi:hypothetical protein
MHGLHRGVPEDGRKIHDLDSGGSPLQIRILHRLGPSIHRHDRHRCLSLSKLFAFMACPRRLILRHYAAHELGVPASDGRAIRSDQPHHHCLSALPRQRPAQVVATMATLG